MRRHYAGILTAIAIALIAVATFAAGRPKNFEKWPAGTSPAEIGRRVAERFISRPHTNFGAAAGADHPMEHITYPETVAWYGALTFAQRSGDGEPTAQLIQRFEPLFTSQANLFPEPVDVDSTVFGSVPFEIYLETKDPKYRDMGLRFADAQWKNPTPEGLTPQTRWWIDDMYMVTLVQVQAYRAIGDAKYLDRAATEMTAYLDKLQQPNGLFFHAPDVPFFWGRGNGWVAAGMTELLRAMPKNHLQRARIMDSYQKMMSSLLRLQGKNGLWRQLLDHPEAWPETSCTGMFTFAMITGVKEGWLDAKKYSPAARKGWLGLISYLEPNGDIRNVCEGTGKKSDLNYYLTRARNTGDLHGQAPLLWSATALLR
jgi:rhamnogalacturonyl hydrolase YesR